MKDTGPVDGTNRGDVVADDAALQALCGSEYEDLRRRCYVALDVPSWEAAKPLVSSLGSAVSGYKVGLELFHGDGPRALGELQELGKRVFLDVKLHDIPNTVAGALRVIRDADVEMVNVHALGGRRMLAAAREAVEGAKRPLLIGVTVLTSLGDDDLAEIGCTSQQTTALAASLTGLCIDCGLDGVVTSALELKTLRSITPADFRFIVPGTRPAGAQLHDQVRTMTPSAALAAGASALVLGRAVTTADDPVVALKQIWDEVIANV